MKIGTSVLGVVAVAVLSGALWGCTSEGRVPETASAPEPPGAYGGEAAPAAAPPATSFPGAEAREESRAPTQRPGLGTEWGETRTSRVHDVEFSRATETPGSLASLRYDDRAGVEALASRHGWAVARESGPVIVAHGAIDLSLRDGGGDTMELWHAADRWYAVGHAGDRYAIVLHNRSAHRFEAVASVDGLDVIDGKPASVGKRGYLIGLYETLAIEGFRQTEDAVAAFRFGRVADSYAAQTGSAREVGAIGVAFYSELGDRVGDAEEARTRDTADPFPSDSRYAQPPWRR